MYVDTGVRHFLLELDEDAMICHINNYHKRRSRHHNMSSCGDHLDGATNNANLFDSTATAGNQSLIEPTSEEIIRDLEGSTRKAKNLVCRDAKCYFFCSIVYCFWWKYLKKLQDLAKYCLFSKFITTQWVKITGFFSSKILVFSPKNTANLFARLASLAYPLLLKPIIVWVNEWNKKKFSNGFFL